MKNKTLNKLEKELEKTLITGFDIEEVITNLQDHEKGLIELELEDINFALRLGKVIGYRKCLMEKQNENRI